MENKSYIQKSIDYKKYIAGRYIAIEEERITKALAQFKQFLVSVKYDGHFYGLHFDGKSLELINRNGKVLVELPIHNEIKKALVKKGVKQIFLAGELYVDGPERTRMYNVTSAIAQGGENLKFAVFELIELEGIHYKEQTVFEKYDKLKTLFSDKGTIHLVEHFITESKKDIEEFFKKKVSIGNAEGLVVKNEGFPIFKIKPKHTFDAVIIGFAQGDGDRSDMLRDFLLAFRKDDGSYQVFAHLSHGLSDEKRRTLLKEYKNKVVKSDYIEVARNRLGFQMVKPETVVEFSCLDVINEDSKGNIKKMNLSYDDENGYSANYHQTTVSVTIPVFIKFREDKEPSIDDVGFKQILELVDFTGIENEDEELPKAEILKREVYTKESRGAKMIRKFVLVKTNKDHSEEFPAYYLHLTDFSSGRKDPLKKDVKVSDSKEQIEKLYTEAILKNIKKGWELVE